MYEYITLNDLINELTKLQDKHGEDAVISIGATCGRIKGMSSPFNIRFDNDNSEYIPAYKHDIK